MFQNTVDYDEIRQSSLKYGTVCDVYGCGSLLYTTQRQYGRITVPKKRLVYCQYTVVNIAFTIVVMVGLGWLLVGC